MTPSPDWAQRLTLMQLADSFFPSGSFTFSHGLEALAQSGQVRNGEEVQAMLEMLLHQRIGPSDLVALGHAYQASVRQDWPGLFRVDQQLYARTLVEDSRQAQQKNGRALLMVARTTWPCAALETLAIALEEQRCHGLHPVVFALVGQTASLTQEDTSLAFLHGVTTGLCSAAIRLGLLGHVQAQRILRALAPTLTAVMAEARLLPLEEMWSCAPALEIAQMEHRRLAHRQFSN